MTASLWDRPQDVLASLQHLDRLSILEKTRLHHLMGVVRALKDPKVRPNSTCNIDAGYKRILIFLFRSLKMMSAFILAYR